MFSTFVEQVIPAFNQLALVLVCDQFQLISEPALAEPLETFFNDVVLGN